ncbi:MAG: Epoxide hydrolase domain protein [Hyphomicrobiales bacterium]|nr:Epoxide hydrolase domain protein [Hyphomicrobiales bacterium]
MEKDRIMQAFSIDVPDEQLSDLHARLAQTRFPEGVEDAGWDYGTDLNFLRKLVAYWGEDFDWRAAERALNGYPQFTTDIDGVRLHIVHAKAQGGTATPLLLLNGWPSNFVELLPLVSRLTLPEEGRAFDVVIPSLVGFGFSPHPRSKGMNLTRIAHLFAKQMTELGYERFLVSGSDLGAGVELSLVRNYPERVIGAHYANVYSRYPRPENPTEAEKAYFQKVDGWVFAEAAYAMEQSTKPLTLAVGLNDSPAGLAAWIVEKFRTWGDTGGDIESVFPLDTLCSILSVYWFTQTIGSSVTLYKEAFADREIMAPMPEHGVPQGVLVPADCDLPAPRAWGERHLRNLIRWTEPGRGGHFPALEIPSILAGDIRGFARDIANSSGPA